VWYAEYDGIWTVREFVVGPAHRVAVGPFELTMREAGHLTEPPALEGIVAITLRAFEAQWEQDAQPRLHALATLSLPAETHAGILYCRQPFPAVFKRNEAASDIYTEYAAGIGRRSFEVFADRTLVAPYDAVIPVGDTDELLRAIHEGVGPDGEPIEPRLRPEEITHAVFEVHWERYALARLRELSLWSSDGQDG
jgi:hypothetical protein